ncbi:helix-turn-helix transcriptional regulator [Fibrella aestuarina]|nr:AraC family transcriptional regulator [Fibrella aestuarina]
MQELPAAYLYIWPGQFLFVGRALDTHIHDHHAVQMVISLDTPFRMRLADGAWQTQMAVLIDSDQPHECLADDSTILFLNLDPESKTARQLRTQYLAAAGHFVLPDALVTSLVQSVIPLLAHEKGCQGVAAVLQSFYELLIDTDEPVGIDERIRVVQQRLAQSLQAAISLAELADEACLSEGRLVHLFKEQVGIPIRKYLLWQRLLQAIGQITQGRNLTQAAHEAGFADSAHFSRNFTRMFGLSPSLITKNSQFVQARICR